MDKIKRNFGFGCMRLPMLNDEVDIEQVKSMVDLFLERGAITQAEHDRSLSGLKKGDLS